MTIRRSLAIVSLLLLSTPWGAAAGTKPYPTNLCVSAKQAAASEYCRRALQLWGIWDQEQNDATRDAKLATARATLGLNWAKAEARAVKSSVDCAQTTLGATELTDQVDAGIAALVAGVNFGLDLGDPADAQCGRRLLQASAKACKALLGAEKELVRNLARDPHSVHRDAKQARAGDTFLTAFAKQRRKGCSTGATSDGALAQLEALSGGVVRNTTVSPNVPDDQFMTISPTGSTSYLGRQFTPVCMNGSPYSFFAKRGTVNKLLIYYQGGGACWEQLTCSLPACDTSVTNGDNPQGATTGFADQNNPQNPFRDWNVVFVSYCSCDVHFGDTAQDYPLHVEHRGYQNARVVEKWTREHFVNPERVFVTGSSAGAYGAWFNAPLHEEVWPASHFDVLADAGNGVITTDFLQNEFPHWNFEANIPDTIPGVLESLTEGTGIVGYTKAITSFFPETRWAHYATAFDGGFGGQTGFYNIMLNDNNPIAALTWWEGSCAFNAKMREQALDVAAAVPSNYRYYIGTGSRHTMWGSNKVYTDTTGGVPKLVDWVNGMLDGSGAWSNVECTDCGLLLPGDVRPPSIPTPPFFQVGPDVKIVCDGSSPSGAFLEAAD